MIAASYEAMKFTGGDFSEGALTAMVVFLYNELGDYRLSQNQGRPDMQKAMIERAKLNRIQGVKKEKVKIRALDVLNGCVKEHYLGIGAGSTLLASGLPIIPKGKAAGALKSTKRTSVASVLMRRVSDIRMPAGLKMPRSIYHFVAQKGTYVGLGTVGSTLGRVTPIVGEVILYYDALDIGACCVGNY